MGKYYIGIDLGGTNIVAGVVNEDCEIVAKQSAKTNCPRPAAYIMTDMANVAKKAVENAGLTMDDIEWVGIGSPGTVNNITGCIDYANNLDFYDVPIRKYLGELLGKNIYIENDANAAAYGEYIAGAAKGVDSSITITLGTGVGGGIIIDGRILRGSNFAGAELGHIVIEYNGKPCTCGRKGCFESYASATGLINMTKDAMRESRNTLMWSLCDGDINNVSGRTAFSAMKQGDAVAKQVVDKYIQYLACGVANTVNLFQPDVITFGGGISGEGETLLTPLRELVYRENYAKHSKKRPELKLAALGNDAGIIGAAMFQKSNI